MEWKKEKEGREYLYKKRIIKVPKGWSICKRWVQNKACAPAYEVSVMADYKRKKGGLFEWNGESVYITIRKKKKTVEVLEAL